MSWAAESKVSSAWSVAAQQVGWGKTEPAWLRKNHDILSQEEGML